MPLDPEAVKTPQTPEWWMNELSRRLLDPQRMRRLAVLQAYADNRPPMVTTADSQRKAFYAFCRMSRLNLARAVVRSRTDRMKVRSIRTAAADDDRGDEVAYRYYTSGGFATALPDVLTDMCTLGEGVMRVMVDPVTKAPIALRRDPRYCITVQDPLNPSRTIAAFELAWDEWAGRMYAYLWLPGEQWVAEREIKNRPTIYLPPNTSRADERLPSPPYWKLSFTPSQYEMRPQRDDLPADDAGVVEDDGRPYSETFETEDVPVVLFENRDGRGEFEDALDSLDRVNQSIMQRLVVAAVQAYKQRALKQDAPANGPAVDRLPETNPETGESIDWDELFQPGPDALWKLPPGVGIWESTEVQMAPMLSAETQSVRQVSVGTNTPMPLLSDDINQSAEGAQLRREGLVFTVEDRCLIGGRAGGKVLSLMFKMAPDEDRYAEGDDGERVDRSDAGRIVFDWAPAERFSLAEKAAADSANKSLSADMASVKIWDLTPDEVAINNRQRASDALRIAQEKAAAGVGTNAG